MVTFYGWPRTYEKKGVKGGSPWAASPFGGERGSPSYLPKNINLVTGIKKKLSQRKSGLFFSTFREHNFNIFSVVITE
jgi:hypothetical protein